MRTFLLAAVVMLAACAGTPRRSEGSPARVVVLAAAVASKPAPRGLIGNVFGGGDEPRDVVAREAAEALRSRGYSVLGVETTLGPGASVEQASAVARQYQADATVVLVLTRLDLSSIQPLGQAEVELQSMVVGPDGRVLSSDERRATTSERLYRARTDWRSHVRQAVIQAVRELP
ncbi:hypothetical protein [Archangium sp.]|jgi:hypothetical protein|uniref:hypothetical protein n=1 Tax=Archangium sp. TaxID=1872627 RepID=UPI002ED9CFB6